MWTLLRAAAGGGVQLLGHVVIHGGDDAVRRERFHREGAGDADARLIFVRAVVEQLDIGVLGDGGVDGGLASDARLPPGAVQAQRLGRPGCAGLARDLPFLPGVALACAEFGVSGLHLGPAGSGLRGDHRLPLPIRFAVGEIGIAADVSPFGLCRFAFSEKRRVRMRLGGIGTPSDTLRGLSSRARCKLAFKILERATGIEPIPLAWKTTAMPLC